MEAEPRGDEVVEEKVMEVAEAEVEAEAEAEEEISRERATWNTGQWSTCKD